MSHPENERYLDRRRQEIEDFHAQIKSLTEQVANAEHHSLETYKTMSIVANERLELWKRVKELVEDLVKEHKKVMELEGELRECGWWLRRFYPDEGTKRLRNSPHMARLMAERHEGFNETKES